MVATHVWKRWVREHLSGQIQRKKWNEDTRNIQVGDLILVVDYTVSRGSWLLGRVVEVFPGTDGVVRSADVKAKFGRIR